MTGSLVRERTVSKEVKKALSDSITEAYASETWVWKGCQRSKIQAVGMTYFKGGCGVNTMNGWWE